MRRRPAFAATVAVTIAVLAGCVKTTLVAEDYSAACEANSDCVIVVVGDMCAACSHDFVAVHEDEIPQLEDDVAAARAACPPWSERFFVDCVLVHPEFAPVCDDGTCTIPDDGAECSFETGRCVGVD